MTICILNPQFHVVFYEGDYPKFQSEDLNLFEISRLSIRKVIFFVILRCQISNFNLRITQNHVRLAGFP